MPVCKHLVWWFSLGLTAALGCSAGSIPTFGSATFGETDSSGDSADEDDGPATISASATATDGATSTSTGSGGSEGTTTAPVEETSSSGGAGETETGSSSTGGTAPVTETSSSSSSGPGIMCGNDLIEGDEACDGSDLGMMACPDVNPMWTSGVLACDGACAFDESGCIVAGKPVTVCSSPNLAIPDNGMTSSTMMVPDMGTITDVDVHIEATHTFIGDLLIDISHGGASVRTFNGICGTQENIDADFDDEAGAAFDCPNSAAGNAHQPDQPLAPFDGLEASGSWVISIEDDAGIDTGTLTQWCVTISF